MGPTLQHIDYDWIDNLKQINVLTLGFRSANGAAFLYPLVRHQQKLRDAGINVRITTKADAAITDCDILLVDSKHFRGAPDRIATLGQLASFSEATTLWWCDTTDSTGTLQSDVIDIVDRYYKSQLLRERDLYTHDLYGDRIASDYYHRTASIVDEEPTRVGLPLQAHNLSKLHVSWNSGLANYSPWGWLFTRSYDHLHLRFLLRSPRKWTDPLQNRPVSVSGRFGFESRKPTLRYQREKVHQVLSNRVSTDKINRGQFIKELQRSVAVVSPFGFGEITLRDFEIFINGALIIKPDMSHLETWPPLFEENETYVPFHWNVNDLDAVLDWVQSNRTAVQEIAAEGQRRYKSYVADKWGADEFVTRFTTMVS